MKRHRDTISVDKRHWMSKKKKKMRRGTMSVDKRHQMLKNKLIKKGVCYTVWLLMSVSNHHEIFGYNVIWETTSNVEKKNKKLKHTEKN